MSIPRITGRQARDLLDGTTPGPWEARPNGVVVSYATGAQIQLVGHNQRALGDAPLMAAAPALAETVAWLYGSEPNEPYDEWRIDAEFGLRGHVHIADNQDGTVELVTGPYGVATYLKPDEAVEVARALLAAAEEARP